MKEQEITNQPAWYERCLTCKPEKAVVKLWDEAGAFLKAVHIPTNMYPLNGPYEVFHTGNTQRLREELYPVIDAVRYRIGFCYSNTTAIVEALTKAGVRAVSYAGWMFVGSGQLPIHHCWAVVDGNCVVDLADDFAMQRAACPDIVEAHGDELRNKILEFQTAAQQWPNSVRCYPLGIPSPGALYIGSPCDPQEGIHIWNLLVDRYPNHECMRNCDAGGMNRMQRLLVEHGIMKL